MVYSEVLALAAQVIVAVSAAVGAVAAFRGVSAWRRELHGRTQYDLARRVMAGVYRVRERIGDSSWLFGTSGKEHSVSYAP
jgi:hypothetical protein